jgi:alpha-methylacyl-CoA racemase
LTAGPFQGIRVVELNGLGPGPFGAMMMADQGAEVIRIDRPTDVPAQMPEQPSPELLARGKRSIALDLRDEQDLAVARRLIDKADVLVDPFRPGVAERLGLAPERCLERNPQLIFARMTGWGQTGPLAERAGHDLDYLAVAGALLPMGAPDQPPPVPLNLVGDFGGGGMLLAFGVAAALFERERSGSGQVLDVAMVDGVATLLTSIFQLRASDLWNDRRHSNWLDGAAPWYRSYRTEDDRFVAVAALEEKFYVRLLAALGLSREEWPQWDTARWPALHRLLDEKFASDSATAWCRLLQPLDVCFAPVLSLDEAAADPHLVARETYVTRDGVLQPSPSPRFGRTPGAIRRPPPWPGQHTEEILGEIDRPTSREGQGK